jgi:F-type H+-transporting ATPase subunit b
VPTEEPKKKAQSIIDALPGSSLVSKTAILSAGAGISTWAISNEFYVLNEETVVAFCLLSVFYGIFKYGGPAYSSWAEQTTGKIKGILDEARESHAESVRARIEDVKPLSNVVDITKGLFEVSKVCILPASANGPDRSGHDPDLCSRKLPASKARLSNSSRKLH